MRNEMMDFAPLLTALICALLFLVFFLGVAVGGDRSALRQQCENQGYVDLDRKVFKCQLAEDKL